MTLDELLAKGNADMAQARKLWCAKDDVYDAMREAIVYGAGVTLTTAIRPDDFFVTASSTCPPVLHTDAILKAAVAAERDKARAEILAAIQSCAPSDVPYSSAKHEWMRLGKKELFAQILKAIDHLAADGTSAAPEKGPL